MSIFWSPTAPARQNPGGIYWWAAPFVNLLASLRQPSANLSAVIADLGVLTPTLQKLTAAIAGAEYPTGTVNPVLSQLAASINGVEFPQGAISANLTLPTAAVSGVEFPTGTVIASMQQTLATLSGAQIQSGSLAASLIKAIAIIAGTQTPNPSFASAAAGGSQSTTGNISISWTHAIESDATMLLIPIHWATNNQFNIGAITVGSTTVTNNAMDYIYLLSSGVTNNHLMLYYLPLAGTGLQGTTQTITCNASGTGTKKMMTNSFTYRNCLNLGSTFNTGANNATPSHSVSSTADGRLVFQFFAGYRTSASSFSSYSQNSRWNFAGTGTVYATLAGDATATASTAFTASITSEPWGSGAIELLP